MSQQDPKQRAQWSSEPAFVFSMAAAAVGLGNLWRFPYMVGENGGAPFILAYLLALVIIALPIMMLEVGAGRMAQGSAVATFRQVHRYGAIYGWAVVILTIMITSYYLVVTGWTLGFAVNAATVNVSEFDDFTSGYNSVWFFFATTIIASVVLIKGVSALEQFSRMLMPVLLLVVVILVVIATQVDGFGEARRFMLQADFSLMTSGTIWVFAFGQAFYTLAIGQGYLVTYGSYIPRKTHVPRACMVVAGTETMVALLAGWMIFPYVFTYGFDPGEGSQLAFSTLPRVFEEMRGGAILAILFFFLFFAAAFSSCLAGLKVVIAAVAEEFKLPYIRAVIAVGVLMLFLGMPSALSFTPVELTIGGTPFLDFVDQFAGTNIVIVSGVLGAGLFAWLVPRQRIHESLGARFRWWKWRIVIVGRTLPFIAAVFLLWRLVQAVT
jgi:neurotransmitter:Na+ symporter, NSS family